MDDSVAAMTATVAAYRRRKQRMKNTYQLAFFILGLLDEEDAIIASRGRCNRVARKMHHVPRTYRIL